MSYPVLLDKSQKLHVAVGVVINEIGEVLISKRHRRTHQGGLWEFPGGKVEFGESVYDALVRELKEELAIHISSALPYIKVNHIYDDRQVLLDVWRIQTYSGLAKGQEGQPIKWVPVQNLFEYSFPAANLPIINAIKLPDIYAILDTDENALKSTLERIASKGVGVIQVRAKSLRTEQFEYLANHVYCWCSRHGVKLLLNSAPELVEKFYADGVHLSSQRLMALRGRPLADKYWVAASCHNIEELQHAEKIGANFVVLSPVLRTSTHPDANPLGWICFQEMVEAVNIPVYALGGLSMDNLNQAKNCGAQGIAGISMFLN